ncbi:MULTISPECIES: Card1-like endonuclease domain-containing protein [unclassified Thiocapsa]|uniref:Card1-like endonuclease domain-containing protein n=1 Tax=unclassified Thiocapsa TaxID=2641286 RepID=UPI0035AD7D71
MKIHIVLVSDQVLANLIPILMDSPDLVFLVVTPEMAARRLDQHLRSLLEAKGVTARIFPDAPDVGLREIQSFANILADQVVDQYAEAEVVLNATGGTKLMSLGFVEAFRGIASRILYTDTAHRRIEYLPNADAPLPEPTPMSNTLDLPDYLAAQGFRFRHAVSDDASWRESAKQRKAVSKFLGLNIADPQLQHYVGQMNYLADQALEAIPGTYGQRLVEPRQAFDDPPWGMWAKAQAELVKAGLLGWEDGARDFTFVSTEAALFVRGGWLEEYAWHTVKDAQVFDVRLGVEGLWLDTKKTTNEFDVLACHINQLLLIECKTLRFRPENENEVAYKLDSLSQDVRGLFGNTWLLSARLPSDVLIERARRARIRLVGPQELSRLREIVLKWISADHV